MKKLAAVLVLAGAHTFCLGSTAVAQRYPVTLCVAFSPEPIYQYTTHLVAEYLGESGGKNLYALNGWIDADVGGHPLASGTATTTSGEDTIHWGLTIQVTQYYTPQVWEFFTDSSLNGTGGKKHTNDPDHSYNFLVSPGPCP